jgi:hypothetical protein
MPRDTNPVPRDSDEGNASEAAFINSILTNNHVATQEIASYRNRTFLYDDFLVKALNTNLYTGTATGTTGNDVPVTGAATEAGGAITMASGTGANEAQEVAGASVMWKPSTMGPITLEARFKVVGTTEPIDGDFTFGLADAVTFTSGVPFVVGASSLFTTDVPTEFTGFYYSSIPTSGTLFSTNATPLGNFIGTHVDKAGTGNLAVSTGVVKNSLYKTYKVVVAADGGSTYSIDGTVVGTAAAASITPTVALTPYFNVTAKASRENTMTIDYLYISGTRPTA